PRGDIPFDLRDELSHVRETSLFPMASRHEDLEVLAIEVAVEIEEMRLDAIPRRIEGPRAFLAEGIVATQRRRASYIDHGRVDLGILARRRQAGKTIRRSSEPEDIGEIDPARKDRRATDIEVRGRETELTATRISRDDAAENREGTSEQLLDAAELSAGEERAQKRARDALAVDLLRVDATKLERELRGARHEVLPGPLSPLPKGAVEAEEQRPRPERAMEDALDELLRRPGCELRIEAEDERCIDAGALEKEEAVSEVDDRHRRMSA